MITKSLVDRLYQTSTMGRWTDRVRPIDLSVLGKHAHRMAAAFVIGKEVEAQVHAEGQDFHWQKVIEGGIFELLFSCVTTDIKSPVFKSIMGDADARASLVAHVQDVLSSDLRTLGTDPHASLYKSFCEYYDTKLDQDVQLPEQRVLRAASAYSTNWEYQLIKQVEPLHAARNADDAAGTKTHRLHYIAKVDSRLAEEEGEFGELHLLDLENGKRRKLLDLIGRLRFQDRWSQTPIIPRRPVLDHSLIVAVLSYLWTTVLYEQGCSDDASQEARSQVLCNNFFGGLFHDLGEILTRDIVSPIKNLSDELRAVIEKHQRDELMSELAPLVPPAYAEEFETMALQPFERRAHYDGSLVRLCDVFSAFMEAYYSVSYGVRSAELVRAMLFNYERRHQHEVHCCQPCSPVCAEKGEQARSHTVVTATFSHIYDLCFQELRGTLSDV